MVDPKKPNFVTSFMTSAPAKLTASLTLAAALITFVLWRTLSPEASSAMALQYALAVILIANPWLFSLLSSLTSTPSNGQDLNTLKKLAKADTVVFEKTGVLTLGNPSFKTIQSIDSRVSDLALLQRVASLERNSDHPIAKAIQELARVKNLELLEVTQFKAVEGLGIVGQAGGRRMAVGSAQLLRQLGVTPGPLESLATSLTREGQTVALIASEGKPVGIMAIEDPLKPNIAGTITQLKNLGVTPIIYSSDQTVNAKVIGQKLGIDEVRTGTTPQDKTATLTELKQSGRQVLSLTLNPQDKTLAVAELGTTLTDLSELPPLIKSAQEAFKQRHPSFYVAIIYNAVAIPLAGGALSTAGLVISPFAALAIMGLSTATAAIYAKRLSN